MSKRKRKSKPRQYLPKETRDEILRLYNEAEHGHKAKILRFFRIPVATIGLWRAQAKKVVDPSHTPTLEDILSRWVAPSGKQKSQVTPDFVASLARERSGERRKLPVISGPLQSESKPEQPSGLEPRWHSLGVIRPDVEFSEFDADE